MGKRTKKVSKQASGAAVAVAERESGASDGAAGVSRSQPGPKPLVSSRATRGGFFDIYKPTQGYHTRVGTAFGFGAMVCWGAYALYEKLELLESRTLQVFIPVGVILALGLVGYWVIALNRTVCDFFIATEGEMKKVNWTSRKEIIGSTKVVIFLVVALSAMLFLVDLFFMTVFGAAGVLKGATLVDVLRELF